MTAYDRSRTPSGGPADSTHAFTILLKGHQRAGFGPGTPAQVLVLRHFCHVVDSLIDVLETTATISSDQVKLIYEVAVGRAAEEFGESSEVVELLRAAEEEHRVKH